MRTSHLCVALALALLACKPDGPDDTGDTDTGDTDSGDTDSGDTFDPADTDRDGFTPAQGDCDDTAADVNPDATEVWYDGIDQNCDAADDWDRDGDGYVPPQSVHHGEPYTGSLPGGDCNDTRADAHPGATEVWYDAVDQDCQRDSDWDQDGDEHVPPDDVTGGVPYIGVLPKDDCDDTKGDVNPDATETCTTPYDDDCDEVANPPTTGDAPNWYLDVDGDGFGTTESATKSCAAPDEDWVLAGGDCDDETEIAYPGATPVACDGFDNDCDPLTFEAAVAKIGATSYADLATALAAAAPSDTITLCEGRHLVSNVRIQKAITIDGLGAASTVIVDASNGTLLWVDTVDPVVLRDLTLTNGHGRFSEGAYRGGAIYEVAGGSVDLYDCEVVDNKADTGAGIYVGDGGTLGVIGGRIALNDGQSATVPFGGGVWLGVGADLDLEDTVIELNTSGGGGGIHGETDVTITGTGDVQVRQNEAELTGAGVRLGNGSTLSGIEIVDNTTGNSGGGLYLSGDGTYTVTDVGIRRNYAGLIGGGVVGDGTMGFTRVEIEGNHGGIHGGGLELNGDSTVATLTDCAVVDNFTSFAADVSGGAYLSDATLISVGTDWGTDAGADDNSPSDVWLTKSDEAWDFGNAASFTCNDSATGTCVPN